MADMVDPATRSRMMAGIQGRDTKPELLVRRALHAEGFRYRLHDRRLPGQPDLVLPRHRAVIFVHGCFWHRHENCRFSTTPETRPEFWQRKFESNVARDRKNLAAMRNMGWRIAIVWECALRTRQRETVVDLFRWLRCSVSDVVQFSADSSPLDLTF